MIKRHCDRCGREIVHLKEDIGCMSLKMVQESIYAQEISVVDVLQKSQQRKKR